MYISLVGKANSMEAYSVAHLIAVRHRSLFCGAPVKMRHRIRLFCGALLIGAPQIKLILWRSYAHAPQNMRGPHTHARVSHFGLYSVAQPCPCATE